MSTLAVVHLGREAARGNGRRVQTWTAVAQAGGFSVEQVPLTGHAPRPPDLRRLARLARAEIVPESLTWSVSRLREDLHRRRPEVVVFVTARAYDPEAVPPGAHAVLDFVDVLSSNYAMRAGPTAPLLRRIAFRCLTRPMSRFEHRDHPVRLTTAAGRYDADRLGSQWLPNVWSGPLPPAQRRVPDFDAVFHGSLSYEPNVEALERLPPAWELLRRRRPRARLLVAGARPPRRVRDLVASVAGWELRPDFASLAEVLAAARVGIAPLRSASGFQNKVLECAAHGLPVVVSPAVERGLDGQFPVLVAEDDADWARTMADLLVHGRAEHLGRRARDHVASHYTPGRHASFLAELVGHPGERANPSAVGLQ